MNAFTVTAREAGTVLSAFRRELPLLPEKAVREALSRRDVLKNGTRVRENEKVAAGDTLTVYTPSQAADVPVVHEDARCLVVDKPAGVNTDENVRGGFSLLGWAARRAVGQYVPLLVHRLDNQTSGLVILAKDPDSAAALEDAFRRRRVEKRYECLVRGTPRPEAGVFTAWLAKDARAARVIVSKEERPGAKEIVTGYRTMQAGEVSRLSVTLQTGRTHQIRAHLAFLGHPVLGDDLYGDRAFNRANKARWLKLCAVELAFPDGSGVEWLSGRRFAAVAPF
jgi:23S rRNA pseudouridine955/2504/2580 synthase